MKRTKSRVNYDLIAPLYDEPGRDYDVDENLVQFFKDTGFDSLNEMSILDMGCGTGKQLTANYLQYPQIRMVGLDLFQGMLDRAKKRCQEISWIQGDSTDTGFKDDEFDYITNQFSYHHIENKQNLFSETYRILKPGGRFVITNLDPWTMQNWILYQFFPEARARDYKDFLPVDDLVDLLAAVGFHAVGFDRQILTEFENLEEFLEYASQRYRTSQLIALSDNDYERGLNRIRARLSQTQMAEKLESEVCLVRITGNKER